MRGDARALGRVRLLDDLHHDFLTGFDRLFRPLDARGFSLPAEHEIPLVQLRLAQIEEGVAVGADVHKRRLHTGQHILHAPFIDVSGLLFRALALEVEFAKLIVLQHRHAGQALFLINNEFLFIHFSSCMASKSSSRAPSGPAA